MKPCPCPPPDRGNTCPCDGQQFRLTISTEDVTFDAASEYGFIITQKSGGDLLFTPNNTANPGENSVYYDFVTLTVGGSETLIIPFSIFKNNGTAFITGPDLRAY